MKEENQQPDPMKQILAKLEGGDLSQEEEQQLHQWVVEDEGARKYYLRYMFLLGHLRWRYRSSRGTLPPGSPGDPETKPSRKTPLVGFLSDGFEASGGLGNIFQRAAYFPLGVVFMILSLGVIALWMARTPPESMGEQALPSPFLSPYVARLTALQNCRWKPLCTEMREGWNLLPDQSIEFEEGLAEVTFESGAKVLLEGPVRFVLRSSNSGVLREGKLTGCVPRRATGFTIHTPTADIVDLGTEFGVSVQESDGEKPKVEAHVFEGRIRGLAFNGDHAPMALEADKGRGIRFDGKSGSLVSQETNSRRFVRALNSPGRLLRCINVDADAFVEHRNGTEKYNFGTHPHLRIKNPIEDSTENSRKTYIRFDLSALNVELKRFNTAILELRFVESGEGMLGDTYVNRVHAFNVFGLVDGHKGEWWSEQDITWQDAPANTSRGGGSAQGGGGLDANCTIFLGTFNLAGKAAGVIKRFSSAALTNFIKADTDGRITLIITRSTPEIDKIANYVHAIASKELGCLGPQLMLYEVERSNRHAGNAPNEKDSLPRKEQ